MAPWVLDLVGFFLPLDGHYIVSQRCTQKQLAFWTCRKPNRNLIDCMTRHAAANYIVFICVMPHRNNNTRNFPNIEYCMPLCSIDFESINVNRAFCFSQKCELSECPLWLRVLSGKYCECLPQPNV